MNNNDLLKDAPPWAQLLYSSSNLHYNELTQKVAGLESINQKVLTTNEQVLTTNEQLKAKVDLLETTNRNLMDVNEELKQRFETSNKNLLDVNEELKQLRRTVEGTFPK